MYQDRAWLGCLGIAVLVIIGCGEAEAPTPQDNPDGKSAAVSATQGASTASEDVLARFDDKNTVRGNFRMRDGGLLVPFADNSPSCLMLPVDLPDEYVVEIVIERVGGLGGFGVGLLAQGRQFMIEVDGNSATCSGLQAIDGNVLDANETAYPQPALVDWQPARLIVAVHAQGVRAMLDGRVLFDYRGSFDRLSLPKVWDVASKPTMFVGSWRSTYRVHRFEVKPFDPALLKTRSTQSTQSSGPSVDLLTGFQPGHVVQGEVQVADGVLNLGNAAPSYLRLPAKLPEEYVIELDVERKGGGGELAVGLVADGRRFAAVFDGHNSDVSGLDSLDGLRLIQNESSRKVRLLRTGERKSIVLAVHRDGVTAIADGHMLFEYRGPTEKLSLRDRWRLADRPELFLGTWQSEFKVYALRLHPYNSARFATQFVPVRWLSDLPEQDVKVGKGKFGKCGRSGFREDARVTVDGTFRKHGLGMFPAGTVSYRLDGAFRSFAAVAAINDASAEGSRRPVRFSVWGDGRQLWRSRAIQRRAEQQHCTVDVSGVKVLTLKTDFDPESSGDGHGAQAVWIDPYVDTRSIERPNANLAQQRVPAAAKVAGVDLLALVRSAAHSVEGTWGFDGADLVSPPHEGQLHVPYRPANEYELTAVVERGSQGKFVLHLPVGRMRTLVVLDDNGSRSQLTLQANGNPPESVTHSGPVLAAGQATTIICRVKESEIQVSANGESILHWTESLGRLGWTIPGDIPNRLNLGLTTTGAFHIRQLSVRPLGFDAALAAETSEAPQLQPEDAWSQDYERAAQQAVAEQKGLLLWFTASPVAPAMSQALATAFETISRDYIPVNCLCSGHLADLVKTVDLQRNVKLMERFHIRRDELPVVILADAEGIPHGIFHDGELSVAQIAGSLAQGLDQRDKLKQLQKQISQIQGEERVQASIAAAEIVSAGRLARYYRPQFETWLDWTLAVDPVNEKGLQEALIEATFAVETSANTAYEAESIKAIRELVARLEAFKKARKFKDPNRAVRLHLAAARLLEALRDDAGAERMRQDAMAYVPTDPSLARRLEAERRKSAQGSQPEHALGTGSGFVVSDLGHVLTNKHVVAGARRLLVQLPESSIRLPAEVVAISKDADIAVIKVKLPEGVKLKPLPLSSDALVRGDQVGAFGYPLGTRFGEALKLTTGTVSAAADRANDDMVLLDARVNPGNSGGPLCNVHGQVVGMVTAKSIGGFAEDSYGMAIPATALAAFLREQKVEHSAVGKPEGAGKTWTEVDKQINHSVLMIERRP